jgi:hypothetical protein
MGEPPVPYLKFTVFTTAFEITIVLGSAGYACFIYLILIPPPLPSHDHHHGKKEDRIDIYPFKWDLETAP